MSIDDVAEFVQLLVEDKPPICPEKLPLSVGRCNFIVCDQSRVLPSTLMLYRQAYDALPNSENVFLCDSCSTAEDIELFFRRAMFSDKTELYCMMHIENLSYNVSLEAEKLYCDLWALSNGKMKSCLVIFMSEKQRQESPLSSTLSSFLVDNNILANDLFEELADWTLQQFGNTAPEKSSVVLVASKRNGMGKSLCVQRLAETYSKNVAIFSWHQKRLTVDDFALNMFKYMTTPEERTNMVYHFDLSREVDDGLANVLIKLCFFGSVTASNGFVWRRNSNDHYIIEHSPAFLDSGEKKHSFLNLLPTVTCLSPKEIYDSGVFDNCLSSWKQGIDTIQMRTPKYQQPIQYLKAYKMETSLLHLKLFSALPNEIWLQTALDFCGIADPSWHELAMFLCFMNEQIKKFKKSSFCSESCEEILPGFSTFVLKFLLIMSADFATHSLEISDQSYTFNKSDSHLNINCFHMKRKWESTPHPYLFFNSDKSTFSFLGFVVDDKRTTFKSIQR